MVLSYYVSDPIISHVDFSICSCFAVPLPMMFAAALSVATGVGVSWWPISVRAVLMAVVFYYFLNNAPNSASVADAITFLIMLHYTCTRPFCVIIDCIGVLDFGPKNKYPPALLHTSGSNILYAFEWIRRIIPLLLYYVSASGCVTM